MILSKRYPTIGDKPDGASSSTVVAWLSNDGGTTWSDAAILGKRDLGQLAVVGAEDDPTIVNLGLRPVLRRDVRDQRIRSGVFSATRAFSTPTRTRTTTPPSSATETR